MTEDPLRKKLTRRAQDSIALANNTIPKHLQKSPSERKSAALKRKLSRGVKDPKDSTMDDCRGCSRYPCGHGLNNCDLVSLVARCRKCGQRVRFRVIKDEPWDVCPVCKERS